MYLNSPNEGDRTTIDRFRESVHASQLHERGVSSLLLINGLDGNLNGPEASRFINYTVTLKTLISTRDLNNTREHDSSKRKFLAPIHIGEN